MFCGFPVSDWFNGTVFVECPWPEAEKWLLVVVLGLEMLMGVVGNGLVLLVKVMVRFSPHNWCNKNCQKMCDTVVIITNIRPVCSPLFSSSAEASSAAVTGSLSSASPCQISVQLPTISALHRYTL